jgi:hypothetical protein
MKLHESISKVETHLATLDEQEFDKIDFQWHGIIFNVVAMENETSGAKITLSARLGRLFYSVENADNRAMAIERLYANNRISDGAYSIGKDGCVHFKSHTKTDVLTKGQNLVAAVTVILLQAGNQLRSLQSHLKA